MTGNGPEEHGECGHDQDDNDRHPDGPADEHALDVWLADCECAEWCGLGLAEEDENGVKCVLVRDQKQYSNSEGDE